MFKYLISLFSVFLISASFLFAADQPMQNGGPPPRKDLMASQTKGAQIKLLRAEHMLSTLVPDPQSYNLIISSFPTIGGEAIPPHVFSDKPTMIVYQGTLAPSRTNEELAFVMAHELGHLNLYHNEKMDECMHKIFTGPVVGISGTTFAIFKQKLQEREADQFGLYLYNQAGYNLKFFPHTLKQININPNIHFGTTKVFRKPLSSLSIKDSHFSIKERFEHLTNEAQVI